MSWTWNRWTILAAILLLSTLVGLAFRPWGGGVEGRHIVENQGLSLECPESITAAAGSTIEFQCEVNNNSRYPHYEHTTISNDPRRYYDYRSLETYQDSQGEKIGLNRYSVRKQVWVYRDTSLPVTAIMRSELRFRELWGQTVRLTSPGLAVTSYVQVEVQRPLFYYAGLGLLLLQVAVLAVSPLLIVLSMVYRIRDGGKWEVPSPFSVSGYRAVDILWTTYIAQAFLMLVYHIWEVQTISEHWSQLPPQVLYFLTLPFALFGIVLLFVTWKCVMRSARLSSIRGDISISGEDIGQAMVGRSWKPFAGAFVTGCLLLPLTYWLYLVLEL
ncbi:MAG: hypothetical protein F4X20_07320 [Dehalococcoidia bacterium]|nr:hypothetical protein [Dehalococcoidia bacterium]